jgi:tRNA pseudouridine38-40 synthase
VRTLKLTLTYDGTRFVGWQRQAEGDSIQGLLEAALSRFAGTPVTAHGAGRTDAGVHALGQVASAQIATAHDPATLVRALNANLPPDIRVVAVEDVAADFHARFSASGKTYRYVLDTAAIADPFTRGYAWHLPEALDLAAMAAAAAVLVGTHDFAAFQSVGTDTRTTVRTLIRAEVTGAVGERVRCEFTGDGFLRHQVRAMVGTLVEVGRGRRAPGAIATLLATGRRADAGATAPPHGLFLVAVDYD